jgi:hypothetical protein
MKRSTDNRRSPAEIRIDLQRHYGGLSERATDPQAAERFRRKPYTGVKALIRRQGDQIGDTAEYVEEKYGIRSGADGSGEAEQIQEE